MARGTHNIPRQFKGENRFFSIGKFEGLTIRGLIYSLISFGNVIVLNKLFSKFGYGIVGIILGIIVGICLVTLGMVKVPATMYLFNSGQTLDIFLFNIVKRKVSKCIYTKTLHPYRDREEIIHEFD
ncbi:hypothetical protein [Vallitalea guaymasensis]|uniref:hypothetical protein n=1 Tax=Vallitalea guaymasensis TaxID=1185412 RepID=UPI000DE44B3C|nr:hypothetical protein [Vallitalea guaymasensis]